jgi:hypothetical protein
MKLGYTFYPRDWSTSDAVFELTLEQRGFYRELIDIAMLNDNKTDIKLSVWARKFATDTNTLQNILEVLETLKLIQIERINFGNDLLFIPSCEARLKLVRAGRKGGKVKPTPKPTPKPKVKQIENKIKENNIIDSIYNLYPYKCPKRNASTGKSQKNKKQIETLLKTKTPEQLTEIIKRYVQESAESESYLKNFGTLLNNLPDYSTKQISLLPEIDKLVATMAINVPNEMERLKNKGYTEQQIRKAAKC